MAMRQKSSTAEVLTPEQEAPSSRATITSREQPLHSQESTPTTDIRASRASASDPNGPGPAQPIGQHRNAADLEDRIRRRAYEIYEARGCQDGHADDDWRLAEEEITGITGGG